MKLITSLTMVFILAVLQVIFLPINFALLIILLLTSSTSNQLISLLIISASLFLSFFGGLGIGVTIMSFSAAVFAFLVLKRYLPDRQVVKIPIVIFSLIFWEIMIRSSSAVLKLLV